MCREREIETKNEKEREREREKVRKKRGRERERERATFLIRFTDHEARNILKENQRDLPLAAKLNEVRALQRGLGPQNSFKFELKKNRKEMQIGRMDRSRLFTIIGNDPNWISVDTSVSCDKRRSVLCFEFVKSE